MNNNYIFKFNSENISYNLPDNKYNDVYLHTGSKINNQWQNCIAVKNIDNIYRIIDNSNHFYEHTVFKEEQDSREHQNNNYKIYDNIANNYNDIKNNILTVNYQYYDDNIYFYMIDPFSFSNSGHNLSIILDQVNYILSNNIKNILIFEGYKENNNFKLIEDLLENCIFTELKFENIYYIKNIIIIYEQFYNINLHENIIKKIKYNIITKYHQNYTDCLNKKIILMKTNRNINVMNKGTVHNCEVFLKKMEEVGYIYIIPENIDIFKLCVYLLNAEKIVFSCGSILYTNKIFFNKNAKLILLSNVNACTENIHNYLHINYLLDNNDYEYPYIIQQIENY